jgi:hypothetical protein
VLFTIWLSVLTMAMFPNTEPLMKAQASAFQARLLATFETPVAPTHAYAPPVRRRAMTR